MGPDQGVRGAGAHIAWQGDQRHTGGRAHEVVDRPIRQRKFPSSRLRWRFGNLLIAGSAWSRSQLQPDLRRIEPCLQLRRETRTRFAVLRKLFPRWLFEPFRLPIRRNFRSILRPWTAGLLPASDEV